MIKKSILICTVFLFSPLFLHAETYYVDPTGGDNSRDGKTVETAWKHLPGTRLQNDSGWDSPSVKISSGDSIFLKSGERLNRRVVIDATYFDEGTVSAPIVIRRKTDWGSGSFTFDGSGLTYPSWGNLIFMDRRAHIQLDGVAGVSNSYDGIIIQNVPSSANGGLVFRGTSEASLTPGFSIQYVKFFNIAAFNLIIQRAANFTVNRVEAHGNDLDTSTGFYIGGQTMGNDTGIIKNSSSHDHGNTPGGGGGGGSVKHGYWVTDSYNITIEDSEAYDNEGDGFDIGTVSDRRLADNFICRRCTSHHNDDGIGMSVADAPGSSRFSIISSLMYANNIGLQIYQGPTAIVTDTILAKNKMGIYVDAPPQANRNTEVTVRNSIFYQNDDPNGTNDGDIAVFDVADIVWSGDDNLFDQGSGSEKLARWCVKGTGCVYKSYYYSLKDTENIVAWRSDRSSDTNSHDSVKDGQRANFTDPSSNNFTIATTPPPPTPPSTPPASISGDFNSDGFVNALDFSLLSAAWNSSNPLYDLSKDTTVNTLDYSIMAQNWMR